MPIRVMTVRLSFGVSVNEGRKLQRTERFLRGTDRLFDVCVCMRRRDVPPSPGQQELPASEHLNDERVVYVLISIKKRVEGTGVSDARDYLNDRADLMHG